MKLARRSGRWVASPVAVAAVLVSLGHSMLSLILVGLGGILAVFFRDPERAPRGDGMLAPADGRVLHVDDDRISIFMGLHNVHVNRAPVDGMVASVVYRPGRHRFAFSKESDHNERNTVVLDTDYGPVEVTQIAGAFARRIECYVNPGDVLARGERLGMIRFASRTDVTIPPTMRPIVKAGDRVKAGETVIAEANI